MLFSVLIAHYNNSRFLRTSLESVIQQTYKHWEIIIVDDGSTDEFDEVIMEFLSDHRLKVFRNAENLGCGYTKKRCADEASGDLMAFLDPDDAILPLALERMVLMHRLMPDHSLIHSTHYICDSSLNISRPAEYTGSLPTGTPYLLLGDGRIHHFASFKKESYRRTQGLSPTYRKAVDQDLYYLLEEQGKVWFLDEPLYLYRIHEHSISTSGKEAEATLWHYKVIQDACRRRLNNPLKNGIFAEAYRRQYTQRLLKISILEAFRKRQWVRLAWRSLQYPFRGGGRHVLSYCYKMIRQGPQILFRTFKHDHQIRA